MSDAYSASRASAAFYVIQHPGYVRFSGSTRREYLQRQTTNDLDLLSPSRTLSSLLTSATGRIMERFTLIDEGGAIGMITQPGHGSGLATYFAKRIFFNDQVVVEDRSADYAQIELHGPRAADVLLKLEFATVPDLDGITTAQSAGTDMRALSEEAYVGEFRYLLIVPASQADHLINQLLAISIPQLDFASREVLRIEAGRAGEPEFQNEYTPFEVGLDRLVSVDKGCYTGQEVLARQVTYDKVVRHLVQFKAATPFEPSATVLAEGKEIGKLSSVADSPTLGPIGLAVIRKPHGQPGKQFEVHSSTSTRIATVLKSPAF